MRKLLKRQGFVPDAFVVDRLLSYSAALRDLGLINYNNVGSRLNNRAEVSLHPRHLLQSIQRLASSGLSPSNGTFPSKKLPEVASDCRRLIEVLNDQLGPPGWCDNTSRPHL